MRLVFINRCYWPDAEATGQLLTELCEALAERHEVTVIAGHPNAAVLEPGENYVALGVQQRKGVRIHRVPHLRWEKSKTWTRLLNLLSFTRSARRELDRIERPDLVVCETDPFFLSLAVSKYSKRTGIPFVSYLQDIYPDVAVAVGVARERWAIGQLRRVLKQAYERAARVIVLSDSMRSRLLRWGMRGERIEVIPNWVDTAAVRPWKGENGLRKAFGFSPSDFVVMHSGNMGTTQPLEPLIRAVEEAEFPEPARILLVGGGCREAPLRRLASEIAKEKVVFRPYQPRERLAESLSVADIHVIASDPRVDGCLAPSKLYGILAVGRPLLVIGSAESDAARLVQEHRLGVVSSPEPRAIAGAIAKLRSEPASLAEMGSRARDLAEREYAKTIVIPKLAECFESAAATPSALN